ncbi:MAG: iron ABC transporter substrate-binding protein, partial [Verrucomicrobiota bacterium]
MRILAVLVALAVVLALPFALKPKKNLLAGADETLVIISPHNEAIRYEFGRAFSEHYKARTGRSVRIDWRIVGGTSEIARYLQGEFYNAFQRHWTASGQQWTGEVAQAFTNPEPSPARQAFLASTAGIGIDLFFGGGTFDFIAQAKAGTLVNSGVIAAHPDWFTETSIPLSVSGEPYYDEQGRWIGTCLAAFGICYNTDSLLRLG